MRNASSFLQWVRRMLHVRNQHPVFGTGRFDPLEVDNAAIFAYVRSEPERRPDEAGGGERTGDTVLCVHNLSRLAQPCEVPLEQFSGRRPIELIGRVPFPQVGELPYLLTLPPFGFFWFDLSEVVGA